jgi:hypothetical protein
VRCYDVEWMHLAQSLSDRLLECIARISNSINGEEVCSVLSGLVRGIS